MSRYGADQGDYGAAKRSQRQTFRIRLECGHERSTWKWRRGRSMCKECQKQTKISHVWAGGRWYTYEAWRARLRLQ